MLVKLYDFCYYDYMPRPKNMVILSCGFCKEKIVRPFHRTNPLTRTGKTLVCNKECRNKLAGLVNSKRRKLPQEGFQKGHKIQLGEKHWNWKGGWRIKYERIRKNKSWKIWREKVFRRDKFTCRKCKQVGFILHPHHIKNSATNLKHRYKVKNGITLCQKCHHDFHNKYGRRSNTKQQIKSFLL